MNNLFEQIFTAPFRDLLQNLAEFLPNFLTAAVILVAGFLIGWLVKIATLKVLGIFNADEFFLREGLAQALERGGFKDTPSGLIGRSFQWLVVIIFAIMALHASKFPAVEDLLARFFIYLPNVFVAGLIIFIGYLIGNFMERATLIASVNAGIRFSGFLGKGVKVSIFLLVMTMALEQLGIGRDTVIIAFAIVLGGIVFALSLAFGLAGKDLAREYLEKRFGGEKGEERGEDIKHL